MLAVAVYIYIYTIFIFIIIIIYGVLNACDFNDNPSLKTRGLAGQNGWPPEETGEPVNAYPAMAVSGGR